MNILIACEESQRVCEQFRLKGHNAYSCDIMNCSGGHPEWHIKGDVTKLLDGNCSFITMDFQRHYIKGNWDMIIAFPPCTHLAVSGSAWFKKKRMDGRQKEAIEFFYRFVNADCEKICIENPIGIISGDYIKKWFNIEPIKPSQIIQPWQFGDNYEKSTCLWLKNLENLKPEINEQPELEWFTWIDKKTGKTKRQPLWFYDALKLSPEERAKVRSKTFPGIAHAMAEQWG